jgi:acyl-[acyl carrier protein]--UDP-N-acetylglucosamine O-acyltransferase
MWLSELKGVVPIDVVRDGEFLSLGLLSHDANRMLVGLYDPAYLDRFLANRSVACVVTDSGLLPHVPDSIGAAVAQDPLAVFYGVHEYLFRRTDFYWKDFDSQVSPEARVHPRAYVAPANVRIGAESVVEPNAVVMERSLVGRGVVVRAGAVVGGEDIEPKHVGTELVAVPHAGAVLIGDRVEVGGNAQVQRAVYGGFTEIGADSKICALVHIAHNARIGERCFIAPFAIVCGSATIGDDVWIGPNATISSELQVGAGAVVTLGSVVTRDVPAGARVTGNFAIDHDRFLSFIKSIR